MKVVYSDTTKLCHSRPSEVIRLTEDGRLYLICKVDGFVTPELKSSGLYNERAPLFLVDIQTGVARKMPNLSSQIQNVDTILQVM